MAFLPALLPVIAAGATAAGTAYDAYSKHKADEFNAQATGNEQKISVDTANAQEGLVRRNSREQLGRQAAAFGAAGVGYGGSSEDALDDSAINQEYDALQTRYKGALTGYGYQVQSQQDRGAANADATSGLLAGSAALVNGVQKYYDYRKLLDTAGG